MCFTKKFDVCISLYIQVASDDEDATDDGDSGSGSDDDDGTKTHTKLITLAMVKAWIKQLQVRLPLAEKLIGCFCEVSKIKVSAFRALSRS